MLFVPFGDGWFRAIAWDRSREDVPLAEPVTLDELRGAFRRIAGDDYGMGEPRWSTRFLSERRQARRYRVGRVFLAGDAAHVHSPRRRPGHEHRHRGRDEPRLEARRDRARLGPPRPPRHATSRSGTRSARWCCG